MSLQEQGSFSYTLDGNTEEKNVRWLIKTESKVHQEELWPEKGRKDMQWDS